MRYYFDLCDGEEVAIDAQGVDLPSLQANVHEEENSEGLLILLVNLPDLVPPADVRTGRSSSLIA